MLVLANNANSYSGGTTLTRGKLSVDSDTRLGDPASDLNFDGGTLQITGTSFSSSPRVFNWLAGGGGFDVADAGHTFTVSQNLTGNGGLMKSGPGTLLLMPNQSYTGGTTIEEGRLRIEDVATTLPAHWRRSQPR